MSVPTFSIEDSSVEPRHAKYRQLIAHCQTLAPMPTAVVHPCDRNSLEGAVEAARSGRRVSHCFVMDVPAHADALIVTDAAVNIAPTLEEKVVILQNAIDLAHALQFPEVRVAILSAMETVSPKVPSTIEAAALCKM